MKIQPVPEKLSLQADNAPLMVDRVMCRKSEPDFMPFYVVNLSKLELAVSPYHDQLMVSGHSPST